MNWAVQFQGTYGLISDDDNGLRTTCVVYQHECLLKSCAETLTRNRRFSVKFVVHLLLHC